MKDRIASKPGRVLVTPENDSPSFYATISMADEPTQEGTPPTKANLLTDATADSLGLGEDATVNEAIAKLQYNAQWKVLADVSWSHEAGGDKAPVRKYVTIPDLGNYKEIFMVMNWPHKDGTFQSISRPLYLAVFDQNANTFYAFCRTPNHNNLNGDTYTEDWFTTSNIATIMQLNDEVLFVTSSMYTGSEEQSFGQSTRSHFPLFDRPITELVITDGVANGQGISAYNLRVVIFAR